MEPKITLELHHIVKQQIEAHFVKAGFTVESIPSDLLSDINQSYVDWFKSVNPSGLLSHGEDSNQINKNINLANSEIVENNELIKTREKLRIEIKDRQEKEEKILQTENLLVSFNRAAEVLLSSEIEDSSLKQAFGIIGEQNNFDVVFISQVVQLKENKFSFINTVDWKKELNAERFENDHEAYLKEIFHQFEGKIKGGETISLNSTELNNLFKHFEKRVDICSILLQPLFDKGLLWGVAGIVNYNDEQSWNNSQKNILLSFMHSVAAFIERRKADKEIKATQEELLIAQKIAKIGSFEIDFIKQRSSFSEQAARLLGFEKEELVFQDKLITKLRTNILPEDLNQIDNEWAKAVENLTDLNIDFRVRLNDTKIYYLNWFLKNTFSKSGVLIKVNGTLQDVSERKESEMKSNITKLIIDKSSTLLFRWKIKDNWPVEFVSDNIQNLGYSVEEFVSGKTDYVSIIHSEDVNRVLDEVKIFNSSGKVEHTQQYRLLKADGTFIWVEDNTTIVKDDEGNPIYHQGILTDISDRVRVRNILEESERRYRTLVQNTTDIISVIKQDGTITYESPSFYRLMGYSEEEGIGMNAFALIHPEDLENVIQEFTKLVENSDTPTSVSYRLRKKDGTYIYLESVGVNLSDDKLIQGFVINSRDVTERLNQQNQLREYASNLEKINKELDQFAYIVSHDLKAPLRAINNLSEWIEEDLDSIMQDDTRKNFGMLKGRISRMELLINGILQYSRAGRMKAEHVDLELNSFLNDLVNHLDPPASFKVHVQENMPTLSIEKIAIEQIFSNFISNAIKYNSNPNPEVWITHEDHGDKHHFAVTDNGPGIPEEFSEKVFVIFQTLQARDVIESTGVGLAIVKKIVEEKGGTVWVQNLPPKGASFQFTIPK